MTLSVRPKDLDNVVSKNAPELYYAVVEISKIMFVVVGFYLSFKGSALQASTLLFCCLIPRGIIALKIT